MKTKKLDSTNKKTTNQFDQNRVKEAEVKQTKTEKHIFFLFSA